MSFHWLVMGSTSYCSKAQLVFPIYGKTSYALLVEPTTKMTSHPISLAPNGLPMFVDWIGPTIVCKQFGKNIHLLF